MLLMSMILRENWRSFRYLSVLPEKQSMHFLKPCLEEKKNKSILFLKKGIIKENDGVKKRVFL